MGRKKRSPGPYLVTQFRDGALIEDCNGAVIAELSGGDGECRIASIEFLEGNARLMAASWDLLRALRVATGALVLGDKYGGDREKLVMSLQNAIHKAQGEDDEMVIAVEPRVLSREELKAENDELRKLAEDELGDL